MNIKMLFLALIFVTGTAAAQVQQPASSDDGLQTLKESYNQQTDRVPSFLGNIVGGETVNVKISVNNETKTIGLKFDGIKIEEISKNEMENPTINANISEKAITAIASSEKPFEELRKQMKSDGIKYKTTTVEAGVKIKIMETLSGIASSIMGLLR